MRRKENAQELKVFMCIGSLKLTYIFLFFCGFHGSMPSVVLWGSALITGRPGRRVVSWFNAHVWLLQLHTHWVVTGLNQFHSCAADVAYRCSKGTAWWFSCATQNTIVCLHFGHSFLYMCIKGYSPGWRWWISEHVSGFSSSAVRKRSGNGIYRFYFAHAYEKASPATRQDETACVSSLRSISGKE